MRVWEEMIPIEDRKVFEKGGFGKPQRFGKNPALIIIDVVGSFTGSRPQNVLNAIEEYRTSCGESAWKALPVMRSVLEEARKSGITVVFIKGSATNKYHCGESIKEDSPDDTLRRHSTAIAEEIAPKDGEWVLEKTKASAFFGTPLVTYLHQRQIDTLLLMGTSTSGCVRATAVDAFSYGFAVYVIEEGCFDRSQFFHNATLYDLNAKYADVITSEEAKSYLRTFKKVSSVG